ncbi:CPBP family intramembrane glutamic endopeptidase [Rhodanobacter aciditrophus]|uniref:CPBP family intramembrane glutamic endopeptidase n=1 Tax=Rhodanobacter aciditrophus TaxID=1623218 RepID=UPI003CECA7D9
MDALRYTLPPASADRPPPPGIGGALGLIALYFVLQVAVGFAAALLLGFGYRLMHGTAAVGLGALMTRPDISSVVVILTLSGAALATLWAARARWPRLWSQAAPPGFGFAVPAAAYCIAAVALGMVVPLIGAKLTELLAHGHAVPQDVKQLGGGASAGYRIALTLAVASIGPLVEELLFRGVLLSALLRRLRPVWAMLASATMFALVHLPDLHWLWYALPNLALLGVVLAWLRLRSGSLWPAVIAHASNNLLAMLALFASLHHAG